MKNKLFTGLIIGLMSIPMYVNAAGTSIVKFEGQNNVNVCDEFKINMVIDNNVLELVNTESTGNYGVIINNNNNKIAAIDFTLANGIYEKTNVYTMTFKAIGEGNTTITLKNGELCDKSSDLDFNVKV